MVTTSADASATKYGDAANWVHGCFIVRTGTTDYQSYVDILKYMQQDERYGSKGKPALNDAVKKTLEATPSSDPKDKSPIPLYYAKRKCRDSSLGGNDAINPLPQFTQDDDIAFPHFFGDVGQNVSMGKVYSENIDDLQQILYLGFGIPLFSNLGSFWGTATDLDLANFVNKNAKITPEKIGYLIGSAPTRLFNIATIPYRFLEAMVDGLQKVPITKYYSFSSQMPMYFRFVNTILVHLATNMNMVGSSTERSTTGANASGNSQMDLQRESEKKKEDLSGMSQVFRLYGIDMAQIMAKRYYYENGNVGSMKKRWTDPAIFESSNQNNGEGVAGDNQKSATQSTNPNANATNSQSTSLADDAIKLARYWSMNFFDNFFASMGGAMHDGHLFIGFRIDKGMGGSETFSNSTGESQIAQMMNEKYGAGKEASFQVMQGDAGPGVLGSVISGMISTAKGLLQGAFSSINMDPLGAAVTGSARFAIPEVWTSSSYSRSASFTITCLAPYGDPQSIFQSEYVPLACILAGALPRGTGHSSYSAPFVCQAYCQGIFASPLCMIESLQVTRGADQFGMNMARQPLKLVMNVTLKDLSPEMYMSMGGDRGIVNAVMGTDDNFAEYMMTLSGMGLRDRLNPFRAIRRRTDILLSTFFKNTLSPYMLGMWSGSKLLPARMISAFSRGRNLPGN